MTVIAQYLTPESFASFGRVFNLEDTSGDGVSNLQGEGWTDSFTSKPLIDGLGHLGITQGPAAPWSCEKMERHHGTEEALFCAGAPIVLAVAPPCQNVAAAAKNVSAYIINPGQIVVMKKGVWHDACRGLDGPTPYYWMAVCGLGPDPWVPLEGGPVLVKT